MNLVFGFVIGLVVALVLNYLFVLKNYKVKLANSEKNSNKLNLMFLLMNEWVMVKQEGKDIADYLYDKGYKRVAIYGMYTIGHTLVKELENSKVEVVYGVDKNSSLMDDNIDIFTPDKELQDVDALIVTAIAFYDDIEAVMSKKLKCPIISLEDIIFDM